MSIVYSAVYGQFELYISNCLYARYWTREHALSAWQEYKRNLRYGR